MDWTSVVAAGIAALGGFLVAYLANRREARKNAIEAHVATTSAAVSGLHTLSGDAITLLQAVKADNAELRKDNEALKARLRAVEAELEQLRHEWEAEREEWRQQCAAFSLERAGWQREIHMLRHDNEVLGARAASQRTGYAPAPGSE